MKSTTEPLHENGVAPQPTSMLGCVAELNFLSIRPSPLWLKSFVESPLGVGICNYLTLNIQNTGQISGHGEAAY